MAKLRKTILKITLLIALLFSATASVSLAYPTYGIAYGYVPGYISSTNGTYTLSVTDIPWSDLSHVSFFMALVNGTSVALSNGSIVPSLISHAHSNNVRCYLTIGGANGNTWPTTSANCQTLADNIVALATSYGFDGVDMDCEFPGESSAYPNTAAFTAMMQELKSDCSTATPGMAPVKNGAVQRYPAESNFGLVMYLSPGDQVCGYNLAALNSCVDWYTFSGYDLNIGVSGDSYQGAYGNPGYSFTNCGGTPNVLDLQAMFTFYTSTGISGTTISPSKMVLGMPLYGRDGAGGTSPGLSDNDVFVNDSADAGTFNTSLYEIPYTIGGQTYGMDNDTSFCDKINWAVGQKNMLGIAMFDLGQGLQSGGPSNTTLVNIWNAIGGNSSCITVGTNPCAPSTCSPTVTPSATPSCGFLLDNFESSLLANTLNGYWTAFQGSDGSSITMTNTSGDGLDNSLYGLRMSGTDEKDIYETTPTTEYAVAPSVSTSLEGYNATAQGATGMVFTIRVDKFIASGQPATFTISVESGTNANSVYQTNVVVPAAYVGNGTYQSGIQYDASFLFSSLVFQTWSTSGALNLSDLYQFSIAPTQAANTTFNFDFTIDDVYFTCPPTPTSTPTSTFTNTTTPSSTHTATTTPTASCTNTPTPPPNTATSTATQTSTASSTVTPTVTFTPTISPTPTNSPTGTLGPTGTFTNTPSMTWTSTNSVTPTSTATVAAPTNTQTPTLTGTFTNTPNGPTNTQTTTPTDTLTGTQTFTSTVTLTSTSTAPNTQTSTNTPSGPTNTQTSTPTLTDTGTSSDTPTVTATFTVTSTFTASPTKTNTPTITFTPTFTGTPTFSPTPTATPLTRVIFQPPFPNPATIEVEINVASPSDADATLDVFTTAFRKIYSSTPQKVYGSDTSNATPGSNSSGVGWTSLQWNLKDRMGMNVADGLYYLRVSVAGTVKIYKVLVLR